MFRFWRVLDAAAHVLHSFRLIPAAALERACDRLDLTCGLTREDMERR